MEMPEPGPNHRRLTILAGSWRGSERMPPSPWDPSGGEAEGRIENRVALDGFAVIQDYEQWRGDTRTFSGHGVFTWDDAEGRVVLTWFDSMGMPPNRYVGGFEGDVLTLASSHPMGSSRCRFEFERDRYSFVMEMSSDGTAWTRMLEGHYRRAETAT